MSVPVRDVYVTLKLVDDLWKSTSALQRLLEILVATSPVVAPTKWNSEEPINRPFSSPPEVAHAWDGDFSFLWRGSRPRVMGMFFSSRHGAYISMSAPRNRLAPAEAIALVHAFADAFALRFGLVHYLTEEEVERGGKRDVVSTTRKDWNGAYISVAGPALTAKGRVPELFWLTVLGTEAVKRVGRERLVTAPAHHVYPLPSGEVAIELTESLDDVRAHRRKFNAARKAVAEHLALDELTG